MSASPIKLAQIDALAKLAEIPAVGSEERHFWIEAAMQHGFDLTDYSDAGGDIFEANEAAILALMSEARGQGQRDVLGAIAAPEGDRVHGLEQALREIISCSDDYKVYAASGVMGAAVASMTELRKRSDAAMAKGRAALATGGASHG